MAAIKKIILLALTALMMVGCRYKNYGFNVRLASNPIDACVEMIERLHKLNLL
jgi:hypothetical protein